MKTLRKGISYNLACAILERNHYGVVDAIGNHIGVGFYDSTGRMVARYFHKDGRLQVICN